MKKVIACCILLPLFLLIFNSCGSKSYNTEYDNDYLSNGKYEDSISSDAVYPENAETYESPAERKIIKRFRLSLETLDYDNAVALIKESAERLGGYIVYSSVSDGHSLHYQDAIPSSRTAQYDIRIPAQSAEEYVKIVSEECNVLRNILTTEEVTDSYYGIKAEMDSLLSQEERLKEMAEKADDLNTMIAIEDKLAQIRARINELNSRLQRLDKSVDYSYVSVQLNEVRKYQKTETETYFSRVKDAFLGSFERFVDFIGDTFIVFLWMLPFLLAGGIISLICIFIICGKKKMKKNKPELPKDEKTD